MKPTAKSTAQFSAKTITIKCSNPNELSEHIEKYVNMMMGKGFIYKEYQLIEKEKLDDGSTLYQLIFTFMKKF